MLIYLFCALRVICCMISIYYNGEPQSGLFQKISLTDCLIIYEYGLTKELVLLQPTLFPALPPLLLRSHHSRPQRSELCSAENSRENQPPSISNADEKSKLSEQLSLLNITQHN